MRIDAPEITGSLIVSGSISISGSLNLNGSNLSTQNGGTVSPGTISGSAQISALGFVSASVTGSSLISASLAGNTITFHKGNQSTLAITLPEGSTPTDITALNAFTASVAGTNQYTASVSTSVGLLQSTASYLNTTFSASVDSRLNSGGGSTDISALNTFTASLSGTNVFTASVNTSITSLNAYTASATESVVTATVTSPGGYYIIDGINKPKLSFTPGITYRFDISGVPSHPFKFSTTSDGTHNGGVEYTTGVTSGTGFIQIQTGYNTANPLYYYCTAHSNMGNEINTLAIGTLSTTASFNSYTQSNEQRVSNINTATASLFTTMSLSLTTASFSSNTLTFTKGNGTQFGVVIPDISSSAGTISGSTQISGLGFINATQTSSMNVNSASYALTASYALNSGLSINTDSFATTGSNRFTGNQTVTGSIFVSGSLRGNILTPILTVGEVGISVTHSMDFSKSNFFALDMIGSALNHITASNIQPGQTVSLKIKQLTPAGTASFSSAIKFPSGSAYTASLAGQTDIITFITYDTETVFASSVKNMI
jgi:hypothetical protein